MISVCGSSIGGCLLWPGHRVLRSLVLEVNSWCRYLSPACTNTGSMGKHRRYMLRANEAWAGFRACAECICMTIRGNAVHTKI